MKVSKKPGLQNYGFQIFVESAKIAYADEDDTWQAKATEICLQKIALAVALVIQPDQKYTITYKIDPDVQRFSFYRELVVTCEVRVYEQTGGVNLGSGNDIQIGGGIIGNIG